MPTVGRCELLKCSGQKGETVAEYSLFLDGERHGRLYEREDIDDVPKYVFTFGRTAQSGICGVGKTPVDAISEAFVVGIRKLTENLDWIKKASAEYGMEIYDAAHEIQEGKQ
jgi:hypothetical protein